MDDNDASGFCPQVDAEHLLLLTLQKAKPKRLPCPIVSRSEAPQPVDVESFPRAPPLPLRRPKRSHEMEPQLKATIFNSVDAGKSEYRSAQIRRSVGLRAEDEAVRRQYLEHIFMSSVKTAFGRIKELSL